MHRRLIIIILVPISLLTGCGGTATGSAPDPKNGNSADVTLVNHIIYMLQENQGFDRYFGELNAYRQSHGLLGDADATPVGASQIAYDQSTMFTPFHAGSMCVEELSSYWNESPNAWNLLDIIRAPP